MNIPLSHWFRGRSPRVICSIAVGVLGLIVAVPLCFDQSTPVLRMSAGPESTRRHAVAKYMCAQAAKHDLKITLATNADSEDCLNEIRVGRLDAAIVSNGVNVPDHDKVKVLGAVQLEVVHVLVRKEMAEAGSLGEAIRGKRVNLGEKGGTEWLLTKELLAFGRLKLPTASQPGDVIPTTFTKAELIDKARAILQSDGARKNTLITELPDCLLVLASMPSTVVQLLIEAADYRIAPLPGTRAFLADNLQESDSKSTILEREFLERTTIPINSYFTTRGYPAADCETVGVRLLVVARKDIPARAVKPLMATIFEGEFARRILPKSPRDMATPYAIHPAAAAYLDRDKPLLVNDLMERISKALSLFGAFSAGALSLYGLFWRKKTRKPSDYFTEIRKIDLLAHGGDIDAKAPIECKELAKYLDDRLLKLRNDLIEDICEGRIKGDQVIANILTLLKDARRNIPTMNNEQLPIETAKPHLFKPLTKSA